MKTPRAGRNPFWFLVVASSAAFCIAVAAYLVAGFGDRTAPLNAFFNRNGGALTSGLAASTMVLAGLALTVDRRQTLRALRQAADERAGRDGCE